MKNNYPRNTIDCTIKLVFPDGTEINREIEIPYDDYLFFETDDDRMEFINEFYVAPERAKVYLDLYPEVYAKNKKKKKELELLVNKEFYEDDKYIKKLIESVFKGKK